MKLHIDLRLIFAILNGKVSTAINRKLQHNFTEAGIALTPEQWTVLLYLAEQDNVSQIALCRATYREKPIMSRTLRQMEEAGLIVRHGATHDHREKRVFITPAGQMLKQQAGRIADHTLREALQGLGTEALIISQDVLSQIFSNISREKTAEE